MTGALFASAPYQQIADPRERVLAYIDFRTNLLQGALPDYTCLLGTMVQDTFFTLPAIRAASEHGIELHAQAVARDIAEAKARYAPEADWSPEGLALYAQASIQGAFILAKAKGGPQIAAACMAHLRRYVECLLGAPRARRPAASAAQVSAAHHNLRTPPEELHEDRTVPVLQRPL